MKNIIYIGISLLLIFASCSKKTEVVNNANETAEQKNNSALVVQLTPEQIDMAGIQLGKLQQMEMGTTISCTGKIDLEPNGKASVSAPIAGIVNQFYVHIADKVQKNQVLASIRHQGIITIQEDFLKAKVNFEMQKQTLERTKKLFAENASSEKQLQMAEKEYSESAISFHSLKAQLSLLGIDAEKLTENSISSFVNVKSPINGYITMIEPGLGEFVQADQVLFEIVDETQKCVDLEIFSNNRMLIKEGQKVLIKPLGDKMTFPTEIHSISRNIDEAKQTLAAQAHLHQNDRSLTVGSIVNADIIVDPEKVYSLPNEAIVAVEGQHYIFVHEGDKFVQHQVTIGITNESFTQILNYSDFMDKELVVKGAYYMIE